MNIGQASQASGVSQRMIRHYEKIGLVPPPARRRSGYRDYSDADVHRLRIRIGKDRDRAHAERARSACLLYTSDAADE